MASILGAVASNNSTGNNYVTVNHTLISGENRQIIAFGYHKVTGAATHNSCTYDSGGLDIAMILVDTIAISSAGVQQRISMWRLPEASLPANDTYTVRLAGGTVDTFEIDVFAIQDVRQQAPQDFDTDASISTDSLAVMLATTAAAIMLAGMSCQAQGEALDPGTDQVELKDIGDGVSRRACSWELASGGPEEQEYSSGTSNRKVFMAASFANIGEISSPMWFA